MLAGINLTGIWAYLWGRTDRRLKQPIWLLRVQDHAEKMAGGVSESLFCREGSITMPPDSRTVYRPRATYLH